MPHSHLFGSTVFADTVSFSHYFTSRCAIPANFIHVLLINVLRFTIVCSSFLTDFLFVYLNFGYVICNFILSI